MNDFTKELTDRIKQDRKRISLEEMEKRLKEDEVIEMLQLKQIAASMLIDCYGASFSNIKTEVDRIVHCLTETMKTNQIKHDYKEIEDAVIDALVVGLKLCRNAS